MSIVITLPIIGFIEKIGVRKIKDDQRRRAYMRNRQIARKEIFCHREAINILGSL